MAAGETGRIANRAFSVLSGLRTYLPEREFSPSMPALLPDQSPGSLKRLSGSGQNLKPTARANSDACLTARSNDRVSSNGAAMTVSYPLDRNALARESSVVARLPSEVR